MRILTMMLTACALSATASAQVPDFTPQTPLIGALLHHDTAEAKRLLESGADPNEGRFISMPPILLAILRQDLELVRLMTDRGADVNRRDRSSSTALMWAAFNETGDATLVEELLGRGADPAAANAAGETALDWAMRRGDTQAVAALGKAGASNAAAMKTSVEKAIGLLQQSGSQFSRMSGCASCHHQYLPQMAFGVARTRGIQVDEEAARPQIDGSMTILQRVREQALQSPIVPEQDPGCRSGPSGTASRAQELTLNLVEQIQPLATFGAGSFPSAWSRAGRMRGPPAGPRHRRCPESFDSAGRRPEPAHPEIRDGRISRTTPAPPGTRCATAPRVFL